MEYEFISQQKWANISIAEEISFEDSLKRVRCRKDSDLKDQLNESFHYDSSFEDDRS